MRILDLFCKAGGASEGYHRAFPDAEIVGVDIEPQPHYPFEFHQADAMEWPLTGYDLIHASPPCHDHSNASNTALIVRGTGWLLAATIHRLAAQSTPWVVENVETAAMPPTVHVVRLCGSSFGLDVRRHRRFASNMLLMPPLCDHGWQTPRFRSKNAANYQAGRLACVVGVHGNSNYAGDYEERCRAMGIDWMNLDELNQAIPPAYTQWIGEQFRDSC